MTLKLGPVYRRGQLLFARPIHPTYQYEEICLGIFRLGAAIPVRYEI